MAIIGIDLGTTNSLVSIWRNNKVELIPNSFGNVLTPSVVSVDEEGNIYVGEVAKERLISNPEMTIASFKKFMGTNKRITLNNNIFTPEELSSLILKRLKKDAEEYLGEEIEEAIISVPAYFNDDQRQATKNAGKIAGLKVERLVNEPSAAALAGRTLFNKNETTMLIIDIGGGTCDISLVECFDNVVSVVAVSGDNSLGGNDFDEVIAKHFCFRNNLDYNKLCSEAKGILLKNAELCKLKLSFEESATIDLNLSNIKGKLVLTRQEFVQLSSELFLKIKKVIQRVLIDSDFEKDEIEDIVLVGGCCKTYIIQKFIQHLFDKIPLYVGEPNQIVGMGVGIYAGIKARDEDIKEVLLTDICPFSLGVAVINKESSYEGEIFSPIIERNTVLPTSQAQFYMKAYKERDKIILSIYQGENRLVKDNLKLGEILIPMPKDIEGHIKVTFTYDINGILEVETEILELNEKIVNVILSDSNKRLSEEEIQEKISKMKNIKIESDIKEKIEYLISLANSLYYQTTGSLRHKLNIEIDNFLINIKTKNRQKRIEFIEQFSNFLNDITNILGQNLNDNLNFSLNNYWYFDFRDKDKE